MNFFTLILKNYIISFEDEMTSNSSHSLMITPCGKKLSFKYVSEFLLYLVVSTSTLLITVGLLVIQIDHSAKITNHNRYNIDKEFRKPHKI